MAAKSDRSLRFPRLRTPSNGTVQGAVRALIHATDGAVDGIRKFGRHRRKMARDDANRPDSYRLMC